MTPGEAEIDRAELDVMLTPAGAPYELFAPPKEPVSLATLKADPEFASSPLVRQGRLSVVALTEKQAAIIERLGGLK